MCCGLAAASNKKRHVATPPPAGVQRRMERNRQKLVGRDKGSFTEQQTEGNSNNNDTDEEETQHKLHSPESCSPGLMPRDPETRVSSHHPAPPSRKPA